MKSNPIARTQSSANFSQKNPRKKQIELPPNFQEVLILHEIELSKKIDLDIVRKITYIYTVRI